MSSALPTTSTSQRLSYSLVGENASRAIEAGLAEAEWYQSPVPRDAMRRLLERRDGPAMRNTALWVALILAAAWSTWKLWPTWWAAIPYMVYAALYASTSDARWHEAGHGTAFKTDWMNTVLYEVASFMVLRESTVWRWSHSRHHSDTIIVGRDPEIQVPRPADPVALLRKIFGLIAYSKYFQNIVLHSMGRMTPEQKAFIPQSEFPKIFWKSRVYLAIYLAVAIAAIVSHSILPLLFIGLPNLFGSWLLLVYSMTQHAGLAENVLDHRLNCRTVRMGPIHRFLYWNMNFHTEHHMYPLVPFHSLPELHELVKDDCPPVYPSLLAAWREILPAVWKQVKDPSYHIKRKLPSPSQSRDNTQQNSHTVVQDSHDSIEWVTACHASELQRCDVLRFDKGRKTYVICRDDKNGLYALDGICTHGNVHLSNGLVKDGIIECPKHNGRFHLADGSPARTPACRGLTTYPVREENGLIRINLSSRVARAGQIQRTYELRVVSNRSVATFIKELELVPVDSSITVPFAPGEYLQLEIPTYDEIRFDQFDIPDPYREVWQRHRLFDLVSRNPDRPRHNNYSIASNRDREGTLRFNVRIATPPPGQDCAPGVGSSFVFNLKPGDTVRAFGPFGDFHIKPTQREMIYVGGGAGMAPLRAHLSHLLETEGSSRRISFWYGARSRQELFYEDYFRELEHKFRNFRFHPALSSPLESDNWTGHEGFIHDVLWRNYLSEHSSPRAAEFYLCGPPMMMKSCTQLLAQLHVPDLNIAYDEF